MLFVRILPLATLTSGYNIVVGTSGCDEKQQVAMYIFLSKMQNKHISTRFAFRGENFLVTLRLIRRLEVRRAVKGERVKK